MNDKEALRAARQQLEHIAEHGCTIDDSRQRGALVCSACHRETVALNDGLCHRCLPALYYYRTLPDGSTEKGYDWDLLDSANAAWLDGWRRERSARVFQAIQCWLLLCCAVKVTDQLSLAAALNGDVDQFDYDW